MSTAPFKANVPSLADRCDNAGYSMPWNTRDYNCCVVNAVAAAFNILWSEAYGILKRAGRKDRRGFSTWRLFANCPWLAAYGEVREAKWLYREGARYGRAGLTVASFLKECDPGKRYVVTVSGHAFAVIGGKVRGESNLKRRVRMAWEVTPKLDRPAAINLPVLRSQMQPLTAEAKISV